MFCEAKNLQPSGNDLTRPCLGSEVGEEFVGADFG